MTGAGRDDYAALVSPRSTRDAAAIKVEIHAAGIGSGRPEEGGGPLRGGLTLMNRFTALIRDPAVPHEITMTVAARDGWLVCEALMIRAAPSAPPVTSPALRSVLLSLYMEQIRLELSIRGEGLLTGPGAYDGPPVASGAGWAVYDLPVSYADWEQLDIAQVRRATRLTPELAANAYKEALASPDPDQNKRPTAAAAERLGVSRGHLSRLLTEARRQGIEGLGPGRQARRQGG